MLQNISGWLDRSLITCWSLGLYDPPPAIGPRLFTMLPPQIIYPYHTCKTSLCHCRVQQFFSIFIWSGHTRACGCAQDSYHMSVGLFEFIRMPFSLHNTAQTIQCFIDDALHGLDFCYCYNYDLVNTSTSPEEYLEHHWLVLECLTDHSILINVSNSVFGITSLAM